MNRSSMFRWAGTLVFMVACNNSGGSGGDGTQSSMAGTTAAGSGGTGAGSSGGGAGANAGTGGAAGGISTAGSGGTSAGTGGADGGSGGAGDAGSGGTTAASESDLGVCIPLACGDSCTGHCAGSEPCECTRFGTCESFQGSAINVCDEPDECPPEPPAQGTECTSVIRPVCAYGDCTSDPEAGRTFAHCDGGAWVVTRIGCDGFVCRGDNTYEETRYCNADEVCYVYQGGAGEQVMCMLPTGCASTCAPSRCSAGRKLVCTCGGPGPCA